MQNWKIIVSGVLPSFSDFFAHFAMPVRPRHLAFSLMRRVLLIATLLLFDPSEPFSVSGANWGMVASAQAAIVVADSGDAVYRSDGQTQVREFGRTVVLDELGVPHVVDQSETASLMCGGAVTDSNGIRRRVGHLDEPLPEDFFDEEAEDLEPLVLTYTTSGEVLGSTRAIGTGPSFVLSVSGTLPAGARTVMERVFKRYAFVFDNNATVRLRFFFTDSFNDPTVIGSTRINRNKYDYSAVRGALISRADSDDTFQAFLPSPTVPVRYKPGGGVTNENKVKLNHAVAKALGLRNPHDSSSDGRLKFNSEFPFDFDVTDGIEDDQVDFEYILLHEVGHLLGFTSTVEYDNDDVEALDLIRFRENNCPTSTVNFGTRTRSGGKKSQGVAAQSCLPGEMSPTSMATGQKNGDGDQASHWKDSWFTDVWLGVMDPSADDGQDLSTSGVVFTEYFTNADLRAFDFIGWDYVPVDTSLGNMDLVWPAHKATGVSLTPTVQWAAASNAFDYQVQIYRKISSGGDSEEVVIANVAGLDYPVSSGTLQPNTTYLWKVTARNPYKENKSKVWQFTTGMGSGPTPFGTPLPFDLTSPMSGASGQPRTPELNWVYLPGPEAPVSFTIQVDDEEQFELPHVLEISGEIASPSPSYQVPPRVLESDQNYYWRVLAFNAAGSELSSPGTPGSFSTGSHEPENFGLLSPGAQALEMSPNSFFAWQEAWEAETYRLEVDDDSDFSSPVISQQTASTSFATPSAILQPSTTYWWRVSAENAVGTVLSTPASQSFTTSPAAPLPFVLSGPQTGLPTPTNAPLMTWSPSVNATQYFIQISEDPSLEIVDVALVSSTNSVEVPVGLLQPGQLYYWQVTSMNSTAFEESSSDTFTFVAGDAVSVVPGIPLGSLASYVLVLGMTSLALWLASALGIFRRSS